MVATKERQSISSSLSNLSHTSQLSLRATSPKELELLSCKARAASKLHCNGFKWLKSCLWTLVNGNQTANVKTYALIILLYLAAK